jgi:ribosomal protein S8
MLAYINTLNLVRLGLHHKNQIIKIKQTTRSKRLLFILLKLNVVLGWSNILNKHNKYEFVVYCNPNLQKQLITLVKPTKQLFLKLKDLKKLSKKFSIHSIYLNTSKGVISIGEALNKKTGGVLFFRIY